jgi:hypothetical protein
MTNRASKAPLGKASAPRRDLLLAQPAPCVSDIKPEWLAPHALIVGEAGPAPSPQSCGGSPIPPAPALVPSTMEPPCHPPTALSLAHWGASQFGGLIHGPLKEPTGDKHRSAQVVWVRPSKARKIYGLSRRKMDELIRHEVLRIRRFGPRCVRVAIPAADLSEGQP